jgi:3-mercaptopyruvate sulfurtransferase SseA
MRHFISLLGLVLVAVLLLAACNSLEQKHTAANANQGTPAPNTQQAAANVPGDGVRRITTVELKNMMDKGEAVVIDVRGDSAWEAGHITGSRHIPTDRILAEADKLPRDKTIVTYCS